MAAEPAVLAPPRSLVSGFVASAARCADRPALEVAGQTLTYAELATLARRIAATLPADLDTPLVAIYAYRSVPAFAGILGTLLRGYGYVPLNPTLPAERNRLMLERSGARVVIADAASATGLEAVLGGDDAYTVIVPDAGPLASDAGFAVTAPAPDTPAYVLFTSGSTGIPKGVTVTHDNVTWLVDTMVERYAVTEHDRISQTHELTFDVSVWDMFVAWERGACLCCPTRKELIKPGGFIRDHALTIWFSVPSTAIFMKRLGMLKPGRYPGLRYSLFAGEPLPIATAEEWLRAAPNSTVENLYGPTELTIVCMEHVWDPVTGPAQAEAGVVPIGRPLRGNRVRVVDAALREVAPGEVGQLIVAGPQVTRGYWRDPEKTAQAFVVPPGSDDVHYLTGDRVRRPLPGGAMTYLGRIDHQIKVRGVRVELGEAEAALRADTGVDAVVALGWPKTATGCDGIVAFVGSTAVDAAATLARLRARLPEHMVPRRLVLLDEMPLGASGKFDRLALERMLTEEEQRA